MILKEYHILLYNPKYLRQIQLTTLEFRSYINTNIDFIALISNIIHINLLEYVRI